jgi:hypothetical protein
MKKPSDVPRLRKPGSGGARAGSGRHKLPKETLKVPVTLMLDPRVPAFFTRINSKRGAISKKANELLCAYIDSIGVQVAETDAYMVANDLPL